MPEAAAQTPDLVPSLQVATAQGDFPIAAAILVAIVVVFIVAGLFGLLFAQTATTRAQVKITSEALQKRADKCEEDREKQAVKIAKQEGELNDLWRKVEQLTQLLNEKR